MSNTIERQQLHKWSPSWFIMIGSIINIVFCSIVSIVLPLVVITIPAIVLNAMLLVPRVDTKRYHAWWRFIPIALVLLLTTIIILTVFFLITGTEKLYTSFAELIETLIFWTKKEVMPEYSTWWLDIVLITIGTAGVTGNIFITLGWYKKKTIGLVEVANK